MPFNNVNDQSFVRYYAHVARQVFFIYIYILGISMSVCSSYFLNSVILQLSFFGLFKSINMHYYAYMWCTRYSSGCTHYTAIQNLNQVIAFITTTYLEHQFTIISKRVLKRVEINHRINSDLWSPKISVKKL